MDNVQFLVGLSVLLFATGLLGVIIRRNLLIVLMSVELMLNGVSLSLVTFSVIHGSIDGAVFAFVIFVVAACEMGVAIPTILLLMKYKDSLDVSSYTELKG
ncbi:NADH-quinone oxidoreductase subunit NuoK [Deltaproteobacteria bacterium TL4]